MKLTTTLAAIALTTSPAFAEGYKPPQEPKPPVVVQEDSGGANWIPLLLVVIGAAVIASNQDNPHEQPRPLVEPDMCMDKQGVFVACGE